MKKILFLLLISIASYGQADFPEGVQISGGQPTVTSTSFLTAVDGTGLLTKISPVNLPFQTKLSWKTPQDYGAIGDGIADDTAEVQAALNANSNVLFYGIYKISAPIEIQHGQYIFGNNATITTSSNTQTLLNVNAKFYWKIDGNIILQGTGKENNTAIGLNIIGGSNYSVQGVSASGISGYGIKLTQGASMGDRGERGRFSNISIQDCWTGVEVGTSYEYISFNQLNASGNAFAMTILAGNVNVNNSNLNDNDAGLYVGGALSTNNSHGIISGTNINHNTGYNVFCENVEYGQTFIGCHIYGTPSGSIEIVDSNGVLFNGCIIDGVLNNADSQATKGAIILANTQLEPDYSNTGGIVYYKNCFSRTDDQLTSAIYDNGTNVGIGTRTPTAYAGYTTLAIDGVSGSVFEMGRNNVNAYSVVVDNAMTTIGESRNLPINFNVNTIDVLTLLPTGNAEFTGTVKVDPAILGTDAVNKDQLDAVAGSSGSYTPTVTASTNVTSATLGTASYTKIGNIVTGTVSVNMQATAINLLSEITITAPVNRAAVVPNYYVGTGTYLTNTDFGAGNAFFSGSSANTITLRFNSGLSVASSGNVVFTFQYDITK